MLGRLGIPVRLYPATQPLLPRIILLHENDASPIERPLFCKAEHRPIAHDELVQAIEMAPGDYIMINSRNANGSITVPPKTMQVLQFCRQRTIPSYYYRSPFYVVPSLNGARAYSLLRAVFVKCESAAIVIYAYRGKEHIGALHVDGDLLLLYQLRYDSEIVPRATIRLPALPKPSPSEVDVMSAVIDRYSGPLYMRDYHSSYADHLRELTTRKMKGLHSASREHALPAATPENEIIPALEATLRSSAISTDNH